MFLEITSKYKEWRSFKMASEGQEKSLNESKPRFSVTEAFSSVVQFLANQIFTEKCKHELSGLHSLDGIFQEQNRFCQYISCIVMEIRSISLEEGVFSFQ